MALLIDSVRRNFGLKATAVVVGVVLWFTFSYFSVTHVAYTKTMELPLALHNVGKGLVAGASAERVSVQIAGARPDVDAVTPADLSAYIDCAGKSIGTYLLAVNVLGAAADKLKVIEPSQAVVVLDRYAYRTVPVVARDAGGATLPYAVVAPSAVQVAGGQSSLAMVVAATATVEPVKSGPTQLAAEVRPVAVDARLHPVNGVSVLNMVRVIMASPKRPSKGSPTR